MSESNPDRPKQLYSAAYEAHYSTGNLLEALWRYEEVISVHPDSAEAGYSGTQVQNIASSLVSRGELVESYLRLARERLGRQSGAGAATAGSAAEPSTAK